MTLIYTSFVTVGSDTGTSVGCEGRPANITKATPLRAWLCVVITLICNLNVKPYELDGKFVIRRLLKLGRFRTSGS